MAEALKVRPSALAGIDDAWMAYLWDQACYQVSLYDLSKKTTKVAKQDSFGAYG